MGIAPRVRAQQDPPGCSGTGLTLNLFVERADGSNAGAGSAVSPCETLIYKGSLTGGSPPACCFQGGTVTITTPDGVAHDVTPLGGVPKKCPGDPPIDTQSAQYQVRPQDVDANGRITARIDFTAAESFTGTPPSTGVPIGRTSVPNTVVPCPPSTPCLTSICDPTLQGTGADAGRMGLCTTTNVTDSTPCAADNAGNPVTAIPGSCKTPGCEAGQCVRAHITVTDSTACSADTAGNRVNAIPGRCKTRGGEAGQCVRAHINVTDSTACSADNAGNPVNAIPGACKTPGCEAGVCVTQHINVTDSTACSVDNAGNPVNGIPGSCKTPGCEAGQCVRAHINVTDSTACSVDNAGNPVNAIPGACKTPGCEAGVCVTQHINVTDSTPCTDTDNDLCTTAGCEGGVCIQTHVPPPTCANPVCQVCNPSTGQCENITPQPPECVQLLGCRVTGGGRIGRASCREAV